MAIETEDIVTRLIVETDTTDADKLSATIEKITSKDNVIKLAVDPKSSKDVIVQTKKVLDERKKIIDAANKNLPPAPPPIKPPSKSIVQENEKITRTFTQQIAKGLQLFKALTDINKVQKDGEKFITEYIKLQISLEKATGKSVQEVEALSQALVKQSSGTTSSIDTLFKIAEGASLIGVEFKDLASTTKVIDNIGISIGDLFKGLDSNEIATQLLGITKGFKLGEVTAKEYELQSVSTAKQIDILGSLLNELGGDKFNIVGAANVKEVSEFTLSMASLGSELGITAQEMIALGATTSDITQDSLTPLSTALTKVFGNLENNRDKIVELLPEFKNLKTESEKIAAFDERLAQPYEFLLDIFDQINAQNEGIGQLNALQDILGVSPNQVKTVGALASNVDNARKTLKLLNEETKRNVELNESSITQEVDKVRAREGLVVQEVTNSYQSLLLTLERNFKLFRNLGIRGRSLIKILGGVAKVGRKIGGVFRSLGIGAAIGGAFAAARAATSQFQGLQDNLSVFKEQFNGLLVDFGTRLGDAFADAFDPNGNILDNVSNLFSNLSRNFQGFAQSARGSLEIGKQIGLDLIEIDKQRAAELNRQTKSIEAYNKAQRILNDELSTSTQRLSANTVIARETEIRNREAVKILEAEIKVEQKRLQLRDQVNKSQGETINDAILKKEDELTNRIVERREKLKEIDSRPAIFQFTRSGVEDQIESIKEEIRLNKQAQKREQEKSIESNRSILTNIANKELEIAKLKDANNQVDEGTKKLRRQLFGIDALSAAEAELNEERLKFNALFQDVNGVFSAELEDSIRGTEEFEQALAELRQSQENINAVNLQIGIDESRAGLQRIQAQLAKLQDEADFQLGINGVVSIDTANEIKRLNEEEIVLQATLALQTANAFDAISLELSEIQRRANITLADGGIISDEDIRRLKELENITNSVTNTLAQETANNPLEFAEARIKAIQDRLATLNLDSSFDVEIAEVLSAKLLELTRTSEDYKSKLEEINATTTWKEQQVLIARLQTELERIATDGGSLDELSEKYKELQVAQDILAASQTDPADSQRQIEQAENLSDALKSNINDRQDNVALAGIENDLLEKRNRLEELNLALKLESKKLNNEAAIQAIQDEIDVKNIQLVDNKNLLNDPAITAGLEAQIALLKKQKDDLTADPAAIQGLKAQIAKINNEILQAEQGQEEKEKEISQKKFDRALSQFNQAKDLAFQLTSLLNDEEQKRLDFEIGIQQRRVSEITAIAKDGNAEQLQLEENRLNDLLDAKERAVQRQRRIAAIEQAINTGIAITESIRAITNSASTLGPVGVGLTIASVVAGIATIITTLNNAFSNIPTFWEGTDYSVAQSVGRKHGRDSHLVRVDNDERILKGSLNSKVANLKSDQLVNYALKYQDLKRYGVPETTIYKREHNQDYKELINVSKAQNRKIDSLMDVINKRQTNIWFDENGIAVASHKRITKVSKKAKRFKNDFASPKSNRSMANQRFRARV